MLKKLKSDSQPAPQCGVCNWTDGERSFTGQWFLIACRLVGLSCPTVCRYPPIPDTYPQRDRKMIVERQKKTHT